jgi:hypothetical protein
VPGLRPVGPEPALLIRPEFQPAELTGGSRKTHRRTDLAYLSRNRLSGVAPAPKPAAEELGPAAAELGLAAAELGLAAEEVGLP